MNDMQSHTLTPAVRAPRPRRAARAFGAAAVAALAIAGGVGISSASAYGSAVVTNPNSWVQGPWVTAQGNCTIRVGMARNPTAPWLRTAGANVSCKLVQTRIDLEVYLDGGWNGNALWLPIQGAAWWNNNTLGTPGLTAGTVAIPGTCNASTGTYPITTQVRPRVKYRLEPTSPWYTLNGGIITSRNGVGGLYC